MNNLQALLPVPVGSLEVPIQPPKKWIAQTNQSSSPWLSLIIPTYNEKANIGPLIATLATVLDDVTHRAYELIVVDDNSSDQTWAEAYALTAAYPNLQVMRRVEERGLATAVIRGWQVAQGEVLGVIDGDLQHPPETLLKMLHQLQKGADLVVASRHVKNGGVSDWSLTRRILSRGAQILGLLICPKVVGRVSDPMSGYFLVRRSAIGNVPLDPQGYKILLEVLGRGRIQGIAEVGYIFQERWNGESKVSYQQYIDYIAHLVKLRSRENNGSFRRKIKIPIAKLFRFCVVGFSGVFIDMVVLFLLSDPSMLALGLTRSKLLAAELAIINNFIWNDTWTFRDISKTQPGWNLRLKRFLKFNTICLMGLILNVLIINIFFNLLGLNRYIANLIAIAIVTAWNFYINLKLSWRTTQFRD